MRAQSRESQKRQSIISTVCWCCCTIRQRQQFWKGIKSRRYIISSTSQRSLQDCSKRRNLPPQTPIKTDRIDFICTTKPGESRTVTFLLQGCHETLSCYILPSFHSHCTFPSHSHIYSIPDSDWIAAILRCWFSAPHHFTLSEIKQIQSKLQYLLFLSNTQKHIVSMLQLQSNQ